MSKWKLYIAGSAPYAIIGAFLLIVALNPDPSPPKNGDAFARVIREYLKRDNVFKRNIPTLIEQLSRITLETSTDHIPPPKILLNRNAPRAQIETTVNLEINHINENHTASGELRTQLGAMRENGFSTLIDFAMVNQ